MGRSLLAFCTMVISLLASTSLMTFLVMTPGIRAKAVVPTYHDTSYTQVQCGVRREVSTCLESSDRIVDGQDAECNEWPWQVRIQRKIEDGSWSKQHCGGTLINSRHVVTAAHCIRTEMAVIIGDQNQNVKENMERRLEVENSTVHR